MIKTPNIVAGYRFEANLVDWTGNALNGTATNIAYENAQMGKGAVFNGSSSYLTLPNIPMTEEMTFAFNLNHSSIAAGAGQEGSSVSAQAYIEKRTSFSNGFFVFQYINLGGCLTFDFGGSDTRWITNYKPIEGNQYIVLTRGASSRKLYVNDVLIDSTTNAGSISSDVTTNLCIGKSSFASTFYLAATLDELLIFNSELSLTDVKRLRLGLHPLNG